jgi:(p)ppGpp synthase/HD superfamily hydrolase
MLFVEWVNNQVYNYKSVVSLENKKGALAKFLTHLSEHDINLNIIDLGKHQEDFIQHCNIEFETKNSDINRVKSILSKNATVIELISKDDAYK